MKCKKDAWIRTAVLAVSLINQLLTVFGGNPLPFSDEAVYEGFSAVVTVGASIWSWWKNNSFTAEAVAADEYLRLLKRGAAE